MIIFYLYSIFEFQTLPRVLINTILYKTSTVTFIIYLIYSEDFPKDFH